MTTSMAVHNVSGIVVISYYPANSHSICLGFTRSDNTEVVETTLYGMSEAVALSFLMAVSEAVGATEMTRVYLPDGTISLKEYLTERAVHKALEVNDENAV